MKLLRGKYFYVKLGFFLLLLAWFCFLMAGKIDLAAADLGRHLKNGEWIVNSGFDFSEKGSPIYENFYSYTHPDFPFVNHHWASGVIFYLVHKAAGFTGLSAFNIFLAAVTFSVFFFVALRESNFAIALAISAFLAPLMTERREIRPETFSCFLAALFFLVLWLWNEKKISGKWLFVLPVLSAFWVNLHVYFFLVIFLIGVFFVSEIAEVVFFLLTDDDFREK